MAKYKTEKRKARVGERVLITNRDGRKALYKNGDVFKVERSGFHRVFDGNGWSLWDAEYEVIVGEHTPAQNLDEMDYDELVALSEAVMKAIRTRSYKLGYDQGRIDVEMETWTKTTEEKSIQRKRDEVVEKAKKDVKDRTCDDFAAYTYDFIVNAEKRTVVALRKLFENGRVISKGIAKCAPDDCFNAHIGKAIALRRALGLEVPTEYLNVPQPTEVRVGDVVEYVNWAGHKWKFTVQRIENGRLCSDLPWMHAYLDEASRFGFLSTDPKTIDDSRAGEGE